MGGAWLCMKKDLIYKVFERWSICLALDGSEDCLLTIKNSFLTILCPRKAGRARREILATE